MPQIDELLGKLNVTLATFIMDPAILFSFFGDPEKAKIMGQVQKLLPIFGPEDIESVLNVKMAFDEVPESDLIFSKILALPGHILSKIFKLNLSSEELEALEAAAERFIHDEDIKSLIGKELVKIKKFRENTHKYMNLCDFTEIYIALQM